MATLTTEERKKLPDSAFAISDKREYPIHDRSHAENALARAAGKPEEGKVKAAVHSKYPELKKAEVELQASRLWKDETQHLVYGVVLEPELDDSQGDIASAEEIAKAAHEYLVESRRSDVQHSETPAGVDVVESFIAPDNMTVGGQAVTKGSWVLVHKIHDEAIWGDICEGRLTGLSIGGSAVRVPEAA